MQTKLSADFVATPEGQEADQILRQCVHCGMCNATCPTYQLLGDELDGPRGRIYLIKQVLEGHEPSQKTQTHLDRCLTCRSCESTCPSGVQYSRLLEIGRDIVEKKVGRSWTQSLLRGALKNGLSNPRLFQHALFWGRALKSVLPASLQEKIPVQAVTAADQRPQRQHNHKVILLDGCVQGSLAPNINAATARVLDRMQIQSIQLPSVACCGAVRLHLNDQEGAKQAARHNIDVWWPLVKPDAEPERKVSQIVMTASGCGVTVKDYGKLLAHDSDYADKASAISALTCDLSELLVDFSDTLVSQIGGQIRQKIVWHAPCSLQHGQQVRGKVEGLLQRLGVDVRICVDSHLCCGSAGTYSILQSDLARRLRDNKVAALEATQAEMIVSANMACQQHLQTGTQLAVQHWIEVVDQAFAQLPMLSTQDAILATDSSISEEAAPSITTSTSAESISVTKSLNSESIVVSRKKLTKKLTASQSKTKSKTKKSLK
jgi:glycolate oxidase iron-sulfur subunit